MSWLDTLEQIQSRDFSKASQPERDRACRDLINMASFACSGVSVSPLPFTDAALMLPIQTAMVVGIGHVQGRKISRKDAATLIAEFAALASASFFARQGIKVLLPVLGAVLTMPAAFAANWAIGRVALEYFKHPDMPREQMRAIYKRARAEGERLFSKEKFERFRKQEAAAPAKGAAKPRSKPSSKPTPKRAARTPKKRVARRTAQRRAP